ncbi:amylo-alpha-1,6-glucosidase [Chitinophaga agri]|uniref:Amylo-alpha-1,6-glucosidase n=1 Tax=Chitinophaga agri TaxID=2703787 RepID=A0A6B9ZC44_9BACT|nr:amylo-alpha-1,6-glucosidase [Chitinophaga agri]QHS58163.1 amylo-alpha-1,6-glucosidase [Chitinophaga agri]
MIYDCFHAPLMQDLNFSATREYLVAAPSGAWAASTISGCNTRKYHGLMVAPQAFADGDNYVLLSSLDETIIYENNTHPLYFHYYAGATPQAQPNLVAFAANPLPQWWYQIQDNTILKELLMDKNGALMIRYTHLAGTTPLRLQLRPMLAFRNMHCLTHANTVADIQVNRVSKGIGMKLYEGYSKLFMQTTDGKFQPEGYWYFNIEYPREQDRGYEFREDLYSPGFFDMTLSPGKTVVFSAGFQVQSMSVIRKRFSQLHNTVARPYTLKEHLLQAAEQFIANGKVKAGYYWFNSWGRDACISLPGLTLATGKTHLFKEIMNSYTTQIRKGLLPNNGYCDNALYNTADASLWLIWALQQYAERTHSWKEIWHEYGQILTDMLSAYRDGTLYNIHMDADRLIIAGTTNTALTWMDAIVHGSPVTPRNGKAVEINALWYNAVCFCLKVAFYAKDASFTDTWESYPEEIAQSFANAFWSNEKRYLADCVFADNKDWSVRPNQLFAVSLPFSPLSPSQRRDVINRIRMDLLTTRGLRTLAPSDPSYIASYTGDQVSRDRAYHQGTVWPWLLGHFTEALLKTDGPVALPFLEKIYDGFTYALDEYCLNTIAEIFDGDFPHTARGAVAQAWSVAELLRMGELISGFKYKPSVNITIHHQHETSLTWTQPETNT